jgi:shikimate kinase
MNSALQTSRPNIVLIGLSGSGKSTVARCLAEQLGWSSTDIDALIEAQEGCPITEIFATRGEAEFRQIESNAVSSVMTGERQVIATGGGAILLEANRNALWGGGFVVYLQTSPDTLVARLVANGADDRPLLQGDLRERLASLLEARSGYYEQAHLVVSTDGATPQAIAEIIAQAYEHAN